MTRELEEVLGEKKDSIKLFGKNLENYIAAENRLIDALSKYDGYLFDLNKEIANNIKDLKQIVYEKATDWRSRFRNVEGWIQETLEKRNKYMTLAYYNPKFNKTLNPILDLFSNPELSLRNESLDISVHALYTTAEQTGSRMYALNKLGLFNKEKIRYLYLDSPDYKPD